jgi:hypothetical protein
LGARGAGREFAFANSLLAHATWIVAEIPQKSASALFEELERKARFLALCAKNAPKIWG